MYACICVHLLLRKPTYIHACMHVRTYVYVNVCMYVYITRTHIYAYTMNVYMYIRKLTPSKFISAHACVYVCPTYRHAQHIPNECVHVHTQAHPVKVYKRTCLCVSLTYQSRGPWRACIYLNYHELLYVTYMCMHMCVWKFTHGHVYKQDSSSKIEEKNGIFSFSRKYFEYTTGASGVKIKNKNMALMPLCVVPCASRHVHASRVDARHWHCSCVCHKCNIRTTKTKSFFRLHHGDVREGKHRHEWCANDYMQGFAHTWAVFVLLSGHEFFSEVNPHNACCRHTTVPFALFPWSPRFAWQSRANCWHFPSGPSARRLTTLLWRNPTAWSQSHRPQRCCCLSMPVVSNLLDALGLAGGVDQVDRDYLGGAQMITWRAERHGACIQQIVAMVGNVRNYLTPIRSKLIWDETWWIRPTLTW